MPAKQTSYLVQLRDQIAKTFDLEELKALAFELSMDWDELHGSRKTTRIQDLIMQLARNGELEKLIESLQNERPGEIWPKMPSPSQQKQDIRTAFPNKPLYQQTWVWAIIITFLVIIGIGLSSLLPQQIADAIPTNTPVPMPTLTPTPSPTRLPFEPEAEGETLIVISKFAVPEGNADSLLYTKIGEAIEEERTELNLNNVRVETERTVIDPELGNDEQIEAATELGSIYSASLIIWGVETEAIVEFNFLNLKEPDFNAANVSVEDFQSAKLANPEAYGKFIVEDLPGQLTFLSFYAIAQSLYVRSDNEQAKSVLEEALSFFPSEVSTFNVSDLDKAYFLLGFLYLTTGAYPETITAFSFILELNPDYSEVYINRGLAYLYLEDHENALKDFDQVLEINPGDAKAYNNKGLTYYDLLDFNAAISNFNQAISYDPQRPEFYNNRGVVFLIRHQYEEAENDFNQAIELQPFATSYVNLALVHKDLGDYEQSFADFANALTIDPNNVLAYLNRGFLYSELGLYRNAISDFSQAISLNPQNDKIFLYRGTAYHKIGLFELAMADFDQAREIDSGMDKDLAWRDSYRANEAHRIAILHLSDAINDDPEDAQNYLNRALEYDGVNNAEAALEDYGVFLELTRDETVNESVMEYVKSRVEFFQNVLKYDNR